MEHFIREEVVEKATRHLPSYARTALGLACAERAATLLRTDDKLSALIDRGLEDGWKWVSGGTLKANELYEQIDPLAYASTDFATGSVPQSAVLSVVSCLYYTTSEIASFETRKELEELLNIGSDMADVGDEALVDCLAKAAEVAENTEAEVQWQQKTIDRLLSNFRVEVPYQLGPPLSRTYFQS